MIFNHYDSNHGSSYLITSIKINYRENSLTDKPMNSRLQLKSTATSKDSINFFTDKQTSIEIPYLHLSMQ